MHRLRACLLPLIGLSAGCNQDHEQPVEASSAPFAIEQQKHEAAVGNKRHARALSRVEMIDDPATSNDESNDQPLGSVGQVTLCAGTPHNGRTYRLDADLEGGELSTIYFPKGGNVDFLDCELGEDGTGECHDETGRLWEIEGEC